MKKITAISNIFLLCILLFTASCSKEKYETNGDLLKKAIKNAADKGNWQKALELSQKAVKQNGKDANARVMLALSLEKVNEQERAFEEIEQAVIADPDNFIAQYTKGRMLFKRKRYDDCPAPLVKANKIKPNVPQTLLLLARTYTVLGISKKAITYYIALAKLDEYKTKPEPYNELGVLFMQKKDYKRALTFFKEAYLKDRKSIPVNLNLAIFWDKVSANYKNNKMKSEKAASKAVIYYMATEKLLLANPQSESRRQIILERIRKLKGTRPGSSLKRILLDGN